jgi:lipid-binding SYLF domain-containing protein
MRRIVAARYSTMRSAPIARPFRLALLAMMLVAGATRPSAADTSDSDRLIRASEVLVKFTAEDESSIPASLLERSHGVAVIPSLVRGGFFIGGRRGRGVLSVRTVDGQWSNPAFITLTGGNLGLQFGAEWADVVLVFANEQSVKNMASGKFTMGGDATAVAGPLGKRATAAITAKAEVYIYTRSRGLYAGAAFEGARLAIDGDGNKRFYSGDEHQALGPPTAATPATAKQFIETLHGVSTAGATPAHTTTTTTTTTPPNGSAPSASAPSGGGAEEAVIYPLDETPH